VIAKGARRSTKRFPGTLDFFNELRVQVDRKRGAGLSLLAHARLIRTFHRLREDPDRFALGCYLLELLERLAPESGRRGDLAALYRVAVESLEAIDGLPARARLRALLELRILAAVGLRPELARCVRCAKPLQSARVEFSVAEGGPICEACQRAGDDGIAVHLGTLRALARSLAFAPAQWGRLGLDGAALREAQSILGRFLRFHVGAELRSEPFLAERLTPREGDEKLRGLRVPRPA
jgi:DNA repair protein RecO (recombination protein O)